MSTLPEKDPQSPIKILRHLKEVELDVKVVLVSKQYRIGEMMQLSPGTILNFDKGVQEPIKVSVNGRSFAEGKVVQKGEKYGLQVTRIIN